MLALVNRRPGIKIGQVENGDTGGKGKTGDRDEESDKEAENEREEERIYTDITAVKVSTALATIMGAAEVR